MADLEFEHVTDYAPRQVGQIVASSRDNAWAIALGTSSKSDWRITKYLTGTLDADSETSVAHGITDYEKILHVSANIKHDSNNYPVYGYQEAASAVNAYKVYYTSTSVVFTDVGTSCDGDNYRIKIEYYK